MPIKKILLAFVSLCMGFLLAIQAKSFENVNAILARDSSSNVFQEIQILKQKNADLDAEITQLQSTIDQLKNQDSALKAIDEQIKKYRKLTGQNKIFGPGITIKLDGNITTPWVIDLVNELFSSGAEAIDLNGIRLVNDTTGFDTLPQGQILLNGSIISSPYVFNIIGEASVLALAPVSPGAIFDRIESAFPGIRIEITKKDFIEMN